jgi:hypothetical protein
MMNVVAKTRQNNNIACFMKWNTVAQIGVIFFISWGCETEDEKAFADQFCKYLQSTPEPDVLIYNRVPKCGSKTIVELLKERHRKVRTGVSVFSTGSRYWNPINYDTNATHLNILREQSAKFQGENPKLLLAGHWNWHNFRGDFGDRTVEHINVLRDCDSRIRSQLFFDLFDEKFAKAAMKGGYLTKHQSQLLHSNLTLEECLDDRKCISEAVNRRDTVLDGITHSMKHYLCGEQCASQNNGDILRGAIANLNPVDLEGHISGGAVAVGK